VNEFDMLVCFHIIIESLPIKTPSTQHMSYTIPFFE